MWLANPEPEWQRTQFTSGSSEAIVIISLWGAASFHQEAIGQADHRLDIVVSMISAAVTARLPNEVITARAHLEAFRRVVTKRGEWEDLDPRLQAFTAVMDLEVPDWLFRHPLFDLSHLEDNDNLQAAVDDWVRHSNVLHVFMTTST